MLAMLAVTAPEPTAQSASQPIRICPLGDSIYESFVGRASVRFYLDQLLTQGGYSFDFVGHNFGVFGGDPLHLTGWDQDHECYSGWQVNQILLDLQQWVERTRPDIVTVHLGTNDIIRSQSTASTVAELGQVVDLLRAFNPNVTVEDVDSDGFHGNL